MSNGAAGQEGLAMSGGAGGGSLGRVTQPSRARTWTSAALVGYGVPMLLALAVHAAWKSLAVPAAGPWAGRLFGHSCGVADGLPRLSIALAIAGPLTIAMALLVRHRILARVPLALWWVAWVLLALGSEINAFGP
jgi:hypothetical protein